MPHDIIKEAVDEWRNKTPFFCFCDTG